MVKTRRNSPFHPTVRSGSGRGKNIGNLSQADPSSDESGNASLLSPKRRRLQSGQGPVKGDGFYQKLQTSVNVTLPRATRRSLRQSEKSVVETRKLRGRDRPRLKAKKGEASASFNQKTKKEGNRIFVDACERVRRSERPQRKLYETLNVRMLTNHHYLKEFKNSKFIEKRGERKRRFLEQQSDSQTDADEDTLVKTPSMYDLVKRKHDQTPTPEKQSNRAIRNAEEQPGDSDDDDDDDSEDDDNDEEEEEDEDDDDDEGEEDKDCKGYQLRKKRPITNRYTAPPMKSKQGRRGFHIALRETRKGRKKQVPYASPVRRVRRHKQKAINMSSSTSSDDSDNEKDERNFKHRKAKSMAKARGQCLPMNFTMDDVATGLLKERARIGSSLADVDPMNIDSKVMFDSVGGLNKQIRALKEMVLFPLMYPEVFEKFKISPPRGVLFHGPPGTGKTLVARALANECSQGGKKVAFFMRKGADCLSKWVGESERQLRLLFDQAFSMRPSIIFFDEIDGLAPVRSSRQDQIHSSIVSTLLALMDGLDSRGEIVVIGATNRIDAIDPALRRPGRFDREFQFALPDRHARRSILSIHTCEWEPKLLPSFISEVADHCVGYCGADIKALCTEAALFALRRRYPQIYDCERKLLLDVNSIEVTAKDFQKAMKTIVPASQRSAVSPARGLSPLILPLLKVAFKQAVDVLEKVFPPAHTRTVAENTPCSLMGNSSSSRPEQRSRLAAVFSDEEASSDDDLGPSIFEPLPGTSRSERYMRRVQQLSHSPETAANHPTFFKPAQGHGKRPLTYRPRFLICGKQGMGQSTHIAPALLHYMEHMTVYRLDLPALYGVTSKTPEEACSQLFREARRTAPCIVYAPHLDALWNATGDSLHATLLSLLHDLPPLAPVLFLATADEHWSHLASILWQLFTQETDQVFQVDNPTSDERKAFFYNLLMEAAVQPPKPRKSTSGKDQTLEVLPFAPTLPPRQLSEAELKKAREDEENTMRELRIFLRDVHIKLITDRRFKEFAKPVDLEEVPDYLDVIEEPMDLSTVMHRIDCHHYSTCSQYLADIDLITRNALKYNPDQDPLDKLIRHRACELSDIAHSLIKSQLEPEFEKTCEEIVQSRERRGEEPSAVAPPFVFTAPSRSHTTADTTDKTEPTPIDIARVAESQPQTTRPRRKKAPVYWGKKPKRRKDARRKLDSELYGDSQSKGESRNDKDEGEDNIEEETSVDQNTTFARSSEKDVGVIDENPGGDEEDEVVLSVRNSGTPMNGDITMLDPKLDHTELPSDTFKSNNVHSSQGRHVFENMQRNNVLFETVPNGVTTQESDANDEEIEVEGNEGEMAGEHTEKDIRAEHRIRNSGLVAANIKEQLEPVLDLLVENTKWATVEMLERYYSALQCCIHQHRHSGDKTRLIRDLELLIDGFRTTSQTRKEACPEY